MYKNMAEPGGISEKHYKDKSYVIALSKKAIFCYSCNSCNFVKEGMEEK
jgi:hypothetical protein